MKFLNASTILGFGVLFLLRAVCLNAQGNACQALNVVVNARDRQRNFVRGLQSTRFRAAVRGKDAKVLSVSAGGPLHRVVVVLDLSGSMGYKDKVKSSHFTAAELVHSLPGDARFALVSFSKEVLDVVPFGHSRAEVISAINAATFSPHVGPTPLWDALSHASKLLGIPEIGDSVVVVSDGGEQGSKTHLHDVEREFLLKGIRIFYFDVGVEKFFADEERINLDVLGTLSEATGGTEVSIADNNDVQNFGTIHGVEDLIANYYVVRISVPEPLDKSASLKLEIVDSSGAKNKHTSLMFPRKLTACDAQRRTSNE